MGIGFSTLNSTLRFDDQAESEFDIRMNTVAVSSGFPVSERWTLYAVLGMIVNGELNPEMGPDYDVNPGGFVSVGFEYNAVTGIGYKPNVDFSVLVGGAMAKTENSDDKSKTDYMSTDVRLGIRGSWNINNRLFPFAALRAFGGPVMWKVHGEDVTGTDIYHYHLSAGTAIKAGPIVAYLEWAAVGEQSLKAGLSFGW